jgi:hypothetical protein
MRFEWFVPGLALLYVEDSQAISNPSNEEAQQSAWAAVSQRVLLLKDFFVFSQELGLQVAAAVL